MELNTAKLFITLELFITVVIEMVAEKLKNSMESIWSIKIHAVIPQSFLQDN